MYQTTDALVEFTLRFRIRQDSFVISFQIRRNMTMLYSHDEKKSCYIKAEKCNEYFAMQQFSVLQQIPL